MRVTGLAALAAAAMLCCTVSAQEKPKPAAKKQTSGGAPPMPKPAAEMKDLTDLIGTWTTEETYEPSPWMPSGGTGKGTNTVRRGPGGFSVLMEQRSKSSMGSFMGHAIMTWDPNDKAYKTYWVDSMTPGVMAESGRKEGDTVVYTGEANMMGKKVQVRDVISDRTPNSYTMTSYMNDGSGEKKMMTIKFTRQEAAAKK